MNPDQEQKREFLSSDRLVVTTRDFERRQRNKTMKTENMVVVNIKQTWYRLSALALIVDHTGYFWGFIMPPNRYRDNKEFRQPVQGGLNAGETAVKAALRETKEEIGVDEKCLEFVSFIVPGVKVTIKEENWEDALNMGQYHYKTNLGCEEVNHQILIPMIFILKGNVRPVLKFKRKADQDNEGIEDPTFVEGKLCSLLLFHARAVVSKQTVMGFIVADACKTMKILIQRKVVPKTCSEDTLRNHLEFQWNEI